MHRSPCFSSRVVFDAGPCIWRLHILETPLEVDSVNVKRSVLEQPGVTAVYPAFSLKHVPQYVLSLTTFI